MWYLPLPTDDTLKWYKKEYLGAIIQSIRESPIKKKVKEILLRNGGELIEKLLLSPPEDLYPLNNNLEKELEKLGNISASKKKIFKAFDYNGRISRNKKAAYELAKRINTRTCVYCNRIYSFTVEIEKGATIARPDFDHWLPKEKHPLLSMSLYNLIPCCPICNRSIKHSREFIYGKHVHPYCSTEDRAFVFQYAPLPGKQWKLSLVHGTPMENDTAELLKTEHVYRPYANCEVKDILDFVYKNPPEYLLDLRDKIMKAYNGTITEEYAYRVVFGTELKASKFLDRPLSKLKRDVLKQLQEALGIKLIGF